VRRVCRSFLEGGYWGSNGLLKLQDLLFNPIIKDKAGEIRQPHIPHGQPCGIIP